MPLFSNRNINSKVVENVEIANEDGKRKIVENWQKGIVSGKILSQNEKKLQSEFLNKIFGDVLGYSYEKHLDTWQLENELKVNLDGRTPDGALGYFCFQNGQLSQQVLAVIELKGPLCNLDKKQNRADFKGTPVEQAFSYVPKLDKPCPWVIVSNCQEIRLYRYTLGMAQYESFNILELLQNGNFKRFCYLLQKDYLFLSSTESPIEKLFVSREQELKTITNEFYDKYKDQREKLFDQIRKHNPAIDAIDLLRCTQKLIDRLIFMCFVRDLDIVQNMIMAIEKVVNESFDPEDDALWKQLKHAFTALDKGYSRKNIPPFNGGLFRKDTLLESLLVADFRLGDFMAFLNGYDYQNQLNINVLGHIFEQSISDIEAIKERLILPPTPEGEFSEHIESPLGGRGQNNLKRKADGVFYTPEYITRYMVEQALGRFLDEAEDQILASLNIAELPTLTVADYETIGFDDNAKCTNNDNINLHLRYWEHYGTTLTNLRVIDPACGSGAFLTQVFDYLFERWRVMKTELNRLTTPYKRQLRELEIVQKSVNNNLNDLGFDQWIVKKNIIQNNLFGVDLNPESVEITKLSLWMKTANKKEKLADMDGNIKQGNSLIDDPAFSAAAFDWPTAFPEVFAAGGFDVVVGNPPYVRQELLGAIKPHLEKNYETYLGTADLYVYFYEKALKILKTNGFLSFITPNKFVKTNYGSKLRTYLSQFQITHIVDFGELPVFEDASTFPNIVAIHKVAPSYSAIFCKIEDLKFVNLGQVIDDNKIELKPETFTQKEWIIASEKDVELFNKISSQGISLKEYTNSKIYRGVLTGFNEAFIVDENTRKKLIEKDPKANDIIKPFVDGDDVRKYNLESKGKYLIVTKIGVELEENTALFKYFEKHRQQLEKRTDRGKFWYQLRPCDYYEDFDKPKIIYPEMAMSSRFTFDEKGTYLNKTIFMIPLNDKYLLAVLNSKLMWFYLMKTCTSMGDPMAGGRLNLQKIYLEKAPIPVLAETQKAPFIEKAEAMLVLSKSLYELSEAFLAMVRAELKPEKINGKLENWYKLPYEDFVAEIKKQKGGFGTLTKQMEWQAFFRENQAKAVALQQQIEATNGQIDDMVFALYGLNNAEVALVRGS